MCNDFRFATCNSLEYSALPPNHTRSVPLVGGFVCQCMKMRTCANACSFAYQCLLCMWCWSGDHPMAKRALQYNHHHHHHRNHHHQKHHRHHRYPHTPFHQHHHHHNDHNHHNHSLIVMVTVIVTMPGMRKIIASFVQHHQHRACILGAKSKTIVA